MNRLTMIASFLLAVGLTLTSCEAIPDLPAMAELTNAKDPLNPNNTLPKTQVTLSTTLAWTKETPTTTFTSRELGGAELPLMGGKYWIAGGKSASGPLNDVWSSTDGINWTQVTSSADFSARSDASLTSFKDAAGGEALYLIGGTNGTTPSAEVWKSADGASWTKIATGPFAARWGHRVVDFNSKLYLLGGNTSTSQTNDEVWTSADGVTWTNVTVAPGFSDRGLFGATVFNGALWVAGGKDSGGSPNNEVWKSTDGVVWEQQAFAASFAKRGALSLTTDGKQLILCYGLGASEFNDVWVSAAGIAWQQLDTPNTPPAVRHGIGTIVKNGTLLLLGGSTGASTYYDDIWTGTLR